MKIPTSIVRVAGNALSTIKKYSPQIMMAVGTITSVAAVVEAVKQTPKAISILEEHKNMRDKIETAHNEYSDQYTDQDYKKELATLYAKTGANLAKTYAMPIIMEASSLVCFHGAYRVTSERAKKLAVALASMTDAYNSYRNKMIEALGEEKEEQIRLGLETEKEVKEIIDEATGKKKKVTHAINVFREGVDQLGPWDLLWGENDRNYDQSEFLNDGTLNNLMNTWTELLYKTNGRAANSASIARIIEGKLISSEELYDKYPNFLINGYTQNNGDKAVVISSRPVKIYDGPVSDSFRYGRILTFNGDGPVVPMPKKKER